jgi:hypothetical protein
MSDDQIERLCTVFGQEMQVLTYELHALYDASLNAQKLTADLLLTLKDIKAEMISHNDFQEATHTLRPRPERIAFG